MHASLPPRAAKPHSGSPLQLRRSAAGSLRSPAPSARVASPHRSLPRRRIASASSHRRIASLASASPHRFRIVASPHRRIAASLRSLPSHRRIASLASASPYRPVGRSVFQIFCSSVLSSVLRSCRSGACRSGAPRSESYSSSSLSFAIRISCSRRHRFDRSRARWLGREVRQNLLHEVVHGHTAEVELQTILVLHPGDVAVHRFAFDSAFVVARRPVHKLLVDLIHVSTSDPDEIQNVHARASPNDAFALRAEPTKRSRV